MKKLSFYFIITIFAFAIHIKASAQSANTSLSNLVAPTKINTSLLPRNKNTYDLGSVDSSWRNIYCNGSIYLDGKRYISNIGTQNTFIGLLAGKGSGGGYNTAIGYNSLYAGNLGYSNVAVGWDALYSNTSGNNNVAVGSTALYNNTTGHENTATGYYSLGHNTTGSFNTANGYLSLENNVDGSYNTGTGYGALFYNASGVSNTATGHAALYNNTTGTLNVAEGDYTLYANSAGAYNTAIGAASLESNNESYNTAVGFYALRITTASQFNTAIGYAAGDSYNNGYNNVFVGANTDVNAAGYFNVIAIGQGTVCTNSSQVTMGNGATNSYRAYANWSNISDGRFKKNIKQNVPGLAFINKLQPITYTLDATGIDNFLHKDEVTSKQTSDAAKAEMTKALQEKEKILYTGFIAQDVEKAAKSLNYNFSGVDAAKNNKDVYGLRYAEFVVPLVKAVQELSNANNAKDSAIQQQNIKIENLQQQIDELKKAIAVNQSQAVANHSTITSSASLQQNTPNPFTNTTNIKYSLPLSYSSAKIIITGKNGTTLKQLNLSNKQGSVTIDASTLAAGAYQYSLYVDGRLIDTKQMIATK